jgi:hypothetical protein
MRNWTHRFAQSAQRLVAATGVVLLRAGLGREVSLRRPSPIQDQAGCSLWREARASALMLSCARRSGSFANRTRIGSYAALSPCIRRRAAVLERHPAVQRTAGPLRFMILFHAKC